VDSGPPAGRPRKLILNRFLRQVFRRYVVLPKGADIALPLWVLHAWTMDAAHVSPLMVLVSPTKRCGKTRVLIVPVQEGGSAKIRRPTFRL
jgi:hypothetical protein